MYVCIELVYLLTNYTSINTCIFCNQLKRVTQSSLHNIRSNLQNSSRFTRVFTSFAHITSRTRNCLITFSTWDKKLQFLSYSHWSLSNGHQTFYYIVLFYVRNRATRAFMSFAQIKSKNKTLSYNIIYMGQKVVLFVLFTLLDSVCFVLFCVTNGPTKTYLFLIIIKCLLDSIHFRGKPQQSTSTTHNNSFLYSSLQPNQGLGFKVIQGLRFRVQG